MLLRRHFPVVVATMFLLFGYIAGNRKTLAESNADVRQRDYRYGRTGPSAGRNALGSTVGNRWLCCVRCAALGGSRMITVVLVNDLPLAHAPACAPCWNLTRRCKCLGKPIVSKVASGLVQQTKPDVVFMDFRMPGMDGLMAMQQNAGGIAAGRPCGGGVGVRVSEHLKEFLFCSLRVRDSQRADVVSRPRLCKD